jgi:hypothetical protein
MLQRIYTTARRVRHEIVIDAWAAMPHRADACLDHHNRVVRARQTAGQRTCLSAFAGMLDFSSREDLAL